MSDAGGLLTLTQLLLAGAFLLVLLVASSWLLLRDDKEARQLHERISVVATPYARATPLVETARRGAGPAGAGRVATAASKLFGYSPQRKDQYPAKGPVMVFFTLIAAALFCQLATSLAGSSARLAVPVVWVVVSRKVFGWFEQRHAKVLFSQFPDALAMIVRAVRVGIPVTEAVRNVSREALEPTATEFRMLSDQLAIGVALEDALRDVASRNQLPEYRFFATALSLQAQTGGGLSETLENLADVIRKRVAARKRAFALASEARMSTYILAALPFVAAGGLALINTPYFMILFTEPAGNTVLEVAIGMLSTGVFVMRTTITKVLR
ncbi:MAG TPA: type II secretion system F family protein [Acetobacteraceae bacterium]